MLNLTNSRNCKYNLQIESIRTDIFKKETYTECCICRKSLFDNCPKCPQNEKYLQLENILSPVFDPIKLMSINEEKSLFDMLPKDILFYIVDRIPKKGKLITTCPIVSGECKHIYHNHCINNWRKKKDCCPLDNQKWFVNKMDSHVFFKLKPKL